MNIWYKLQKNTTNSCYGGTIWNRFSCIGTSGGKNILSNLSNEVKPIVLTVLEGILKDGLENFTTRPIDKKITPTLYEIKKKDVRIFYYRGLDNTINIVYITEHKQKNKTEKTDKKTAVDREKRMLKNPLIHREHI